MAIPRLCLKLTAAAGPFLLIASIDAVVLDIDVFNFRVWEAVASCKMFSGPFYPYIHIRKLEVGDLAHHTGYEVPKQVEWYTDAYGFRNIPSDTLVHDLVLVGDSNVVGCASSQQETLAAQIQHDTGIRTYSYAPQIDFSFFLRDPLLVNLKPRVVVYSITERYLGEHLAKTPPISAPPRMPPGLPIKRWLEQFAAWRHAAVFVDRFLKLSILHYCRARVAATNSPGIQPSVAPKVLTLEGQKALHESDTADIDQIVAVITSYSAYMDGMRIQLIFMPIPNKETIFSGQLGDSSPPELIPEVVRRLRNKGVMAIDLQKPFMKATASGKLLYHLDDSHWNSQGISLAAFQLAQVLPRLSNILKPQTGETQ